MTAPAQLILEVRPGYCRNCGVVRLSVADTSGVCMFCCDQLTEDLRGRAPGKLCPCGRGPKVYRSRCRECNREYTARQRERNNQQYHDRKRRPPQRGRS